MAHQELFDLAEADGLLRGFREERGLIGSLERSLAVFSEDEVFASLEKLSALVDEQVVHPSVANMVKGSLAEILNAIRTVKSEVHVEFAGSIASGS